VLTVLLDDDHGGCKNWLAAKHAYGRKRSTLHGYREKLTPVIAELGDLEVQKLTKRDIDDLVAALRRGGMKSPTGGDRKPWTPRSVNYMLSLLTAVLESEMKQGHVVRNMAALVDRIPADPKPADTLREAEVEAVLKHIKDDRYGIAWQLVEDTPKSRSGGRTLPLPEHLVTAFRAARSIQASDRLAFGATYQASGYVVVKETGEPLSPHALTSRWARMLKAAGARHVRLHDARHTCGTLMHYHNVPIALISAWLGHSSKGFTMQTYVHSQPEALAEAARSFTQVVTIRDNSGHA
jgi:integrase